MLSQAASALLLQRLALDGAFGAKMPMRQAQRTGGGAEALAALGYTAAELDRAWQGLKQTAVPERDG